MNFKNEITDDKDNISYWISFLYEKKHSLKEFMEIEKFRKSAIENVDRIAGSVFEMKKQDGLFYQDLIIFYKIAYEYGKCFEISKRAIEEGYIECCSYKISLLLNNIICGVDDYGEDCEEIEKMFEPVVKSVIKTYLVEKNSVEKRELDETKACHPGLFFSFNIFDKQELNETEIYYFILFFSFNLFYIKKRQDLNKVLEIGKYLETKVEDKKFFSGYCYILLGFIWFNLDRDKDKSKRIFPKLFGMVRKIDESYRDKNYYIYLANALSNFMECAKDTETISTGRVNYEKIIFIVDELFKEVKGTKNQSRDVYSALEYVALLTNTLEGMQEIAKIHEYVYNRKDLSYYSKECASFFMECCSWFLKEKKNIDGQPLSPENKNKFSKAVEYYHNQYKVLDDGFIKYTKEGILHNLPNEVIENLRMAYQLDLTSPELYKIVLDYYQNANNYTEQLNECKKLIENDKRLKSSKRRELLGLQKETNKNLAEDYENSTTSSYYEEEFEEVSERLESSSAEMDSSFTSSSRSSLNKK